MDEMKQRYLRGQIEALMTIEEIMERLIITDNIDLENDFYIVLVKAENELIKRVEDYNNFNGLYTHLDWSVEALQWMEEELTPDYKSFLKQNKKIDKIKSKIIYTDGEIKEMKRMEKCNRFFE